MQLQLQYKKAKHTWTEFFVVHKCMYYVKRPVLFIYLFYLFFYTIDKVYLQVSKKCTH